MPNQDTLASWNILADLGFNSDTEVISESVPGLTFDFGNCRLSASFVTSRFSQDIILFTGVLKRLRSLHRIQFETSRKGMSRELCTASIIWNLDKISDNGIFVAEREVSWITEGRNHKHILPWEIARVQEERELKEYMERPHCFVERPWLKLALNNLSKYLAEASEKEQVLFEFNGRTLTISYGEKAAIVGARGVSWPSVYSISTANLRHLPKRLMSSQITISIWKSKLRIGGNLYGGVTEIT